MENAQEGTNKLRDGEGQEQISHLEVSEEKSSPPKPGEITTQEGKSLHTESPHNPEAENAENQHFDSRADRITRQKLKNQPNPKI